MQKGQLIKRHGAWHLRYWRDGKRVCQRLAPFNDTFRTERSVRPLVDEILGPLNEGRQPGGPQTLQNFIERTYLPYAKEHKRPSTYKGYYNLYQCHIAKRVAGVKLWQFRTVDCQRLLDTIASSVPLSNSSLFNIKTFLSAVFAEAKRLGVLDGVNPVQGVRVPKGQPGKPTYAYSPQEINKLTAVLKGHARTAVIVAAYTGLSLAELKGLQWGDITNGQLVVQRTVWHGQEGPTKTEARNAPLPVLPVVAKALAAHRKENPGTKWVFQGPTGRPYDLATLGSKSIKPGLQSHGLTWHGWHALRRGFATTLHAAGVQDKIIQELMRHSSLSVTMEHYVKALPAANVAAVKRLGNSFGQRKR
jgi:integrase